MLTEIVIGIVFAGHASAAAALPFLAWQASFADAFRAIMLAFIAATLLVPLMRKVSVPAPTDGGAH